MKTIHGGLDTAEMRRLGLRAADVIDFSASINPLGTSEHVRRAAADVDLSSYPDRDCLDLQGALADRLDGGATCLIFEPTLGEYEAAARLAGATVHRVIAEEAAGFRWSIESAEQVIRQVCPVLVFLCNPNNPTGLYLDRASVNRIRAAIPPAGLLVLDDAYGPLSADRWDPAPLLDAGNVAILRSMTKEHALAGVRLGYMLALPELVESVRRFQPAWSVNSVAQAAGLAALEDERHIEAARAVVRASKAYLYEQLTSMDLEFTKSAANFLIVKVGDAARVRTALLRFGIAVRDCASFGLSGHIRVAVRTEEECAQLVSALRQVLGR